MTNLLKVLLPLLGLACSITQRVTPVAPLEPTQICIIENPDVRSGFLTEYKCPINRSRVIPALRAVRTVFTPSARESPSFGAERVGRPGEIR